MDTPYEGDERPISNQDMNLLDLLAEFIGLSDDTDSAGRIMILGPTGKFIGDATLSARDIRVATAALTAARALTDATSDLAMPSDEVDPALEADLEEHCLGLDTDLLMEMAAQDPNSAVAAFDEITSQDGDA